MPEAAGDPGQARETDAGLFHETLGLGLELRQLGQEIQPALERKAYRQQVAREIYRQPAETGARVPGKGKQQQHARYDQHAVRKSHDVVDLARSEERRVGKECRSRWSP